MGPVVNAADKDLCTYWHFSRCPKNRLRSNVFSLVVQAISAAYIVVALISFRNVQQVNNLCVF